MKKIKLLCFMSLIVFMLVACNAVVAEEAYEMAVDETVVEEVVEELSELSEIENALEEIEIAVMALDRESSAQLNSEKLESLHFESQELLELLNAIKYDFSSYESDNFEDYCINSGGIFSYDETSMGCADHDAYPLAKLFDIRDRSHDLSWRLTMIPIYFEFRVEVNTLVEAIESGEFDPDSFNDYLAEVALEAGIGGVDFQRFMIENRDLFPDYCLQEVNWNCDGGRRDATENEIFRMLMNW